MKYNCDVIKDLLPLYHDEVCSEESKFMVEEHIEECERCRAVLEKLKNTVCDDLLEGQSQNILEAYMKKEKKYSTRVGLIMGGILMVPVAICLMCNLVMGRELDWFFIVLTGLMVFGSLTVVPLVSVEKRLIKSVISFIISLTLLLLTCCIYVKGDWFFLVIIPIYFGLSLIFTPIFLCQYHLPKSIRNAKGLVAMIINTILLYGVIGVCGLYVQTNYYWPISLWMTSIGCIAAWMIFFIIRYMQVNKFIKSGLCTMLIGILIGITNPIIGVILQDTKQLSNGINSIVGIVVVVIGIVLYGIGISLHKKQR